MSNRTARTQTEHNSKSMKHKLFSHFFFPSFALIFVLNADLKRFVWIFSSRCIMETEMEMVS